MSGSRRSRDLGQVRRLEVGLVGLRWFVVGFGVLQTIVTLQVRTDAPGYVAPVGLVLVAALAIGNMFVSTVTERAERAEQVKRVGALAFAMDVAILTGLIWTYSTRPGDSTWVVAFILPLEGAIRYELGGALMPVAIALVSQAMRELVYQARFTGYRPNFAAVGFRVGVELVVAVVAGLMARSLRREADKARERAWAAEEAARLAEEAARREAAARREVSAFHTAILAGVAAPDVDSGIRSMAQTIARDLDLESLGILLVDGEHLVAKGVHGSPGYGADELIPFGQGVVGRVAAGGASLLAPAAFEGEACEVAVPLKVGTELIGVLHKRNAAGPIPPEELDLLSGLADQIAMVVHAALLRARQEETLRRLRELDEMKSDFVAITSHELRTPLAAVRGFVNTLRRRIDALTPAETQEFLGIIDQQTQRLIRLVEDLLVASRIEAGKISFDPEPVEPRGFLDRMIQALGDERPRVVLDNASDLPPSFVVDPHRLDQVLTNLIQNALKFSPPHAPVTLRARRIDESIAFSVADQGVGVPQSEQGRIFDRFHQADSASTRNAEGAGLGLYITKRLVEAMGGTITVESEPGQGSVFTVTLPAGQLARAPARPSAAARAG